MQQLRLGDFSVRCSFCQKPTRSVPDPGERSARRPRLFMRLRRLTRKNWCSPGDVRPAFRRLPCATPARLDLDNRSSSLYRRDCDLLYPVAERLAAGDLLKTANRPGFQLRGRHQREPTFWRGTSDALDGKAVNVAAAAVFRIRRVAELVSESVADSRAAVLNGESRTLPWV